MRTGANLCNIVLVGLIAMYPAIVGTYLVHAGYVPENSALHMLLAALTFGFSVYMVRRFGEQGDRIFTWIVGFIVTAVIVNVTKVVGAVVRFML